MLEEEGCLEVFLSLIGADGRKKPFEVRACVGEGVKGGREDGREGGRKAGGAEKGILERSVARVRERRKER